MASPSVRSPVLAKRSAYEAHTPVHLTDTFQTDNAGLLTYGDEFEFKLTGEDGNWSAFRFFGHVTHPKGGEWINVFGGDPVRSEHAHRRQWHSLDVEKVRTQARPIRAIWRATNGRHAS